MLMETSIAADTICGIDHRAANIHRNCGGYIQRHILTREVILALDGDMIRIEEFHMSRLTGIVSIAGHIELVAGTRREFKSTACILCSALQQQIGGRRGVNRHSVAVIVVIAYTVGQLVTPPLPTMTNEHMAITPVTFTAGLKGVY